MFVGGTVEAFSVDPRRLGTVTVARGAHRRAPAPRPGLPASRAGVQDRREGGVSQERESSQGWTEHRKGGSGVGTLSWVSQGTPVTQGPQGLRQGTPESLGVVWSGIIWVHKRPLQCPPHMGTPLIPELLVAVGKCRLRVVSSHGARVRVSQPGDPSLSSPCGLPPSPGWAVITAPGPLPATPPRSSPGPTLPSSPQPSIPGLMPHP